MTASSGTSITFTAGRYNRKQTEWQDAKGTPSVTVTERLFRVIFDAADEETIDITGDFDPSILLGLVGLGPLGAEEATARLRLVCRWACRRNLRVHFGPDEETPH